MAIKNIQTLQYNHDVFEQNEKEQYIQALANAGQRIGVKGDSITLDQFSFLDILKENPEFNGSEQEKNRYKYIGKIVYSLDFNGIPQCNFSVLSKENFVKGKFNDVENNYTINYKDIFNVYNTDRFSIDIQINNYSFIKENSLFKLDGNYFTNIMFAKIIGSDDYTTIDDSSKYNLELHYDKYNTLNNKLEDAIRIFHINDYTNPEFALLYYHLLDDDNIKVYTSNPVYELEAWYLVISKNHPMDIQTFENYLCDSKDSNRSKYDIFSLIESLDISKIDHLFNESSTDTIFSYFLKRGVKINPSTHILVEYNNEIAGGYQFLEKKNDGSYRPIADGNSSEQIDSLFSAFNQLTDKHDITIKDRIYYMSNDISLLYPRLLEKYCNDIFFGNISSLAKQIFCRLYENILLEYSDKTDISVNDNSSSIYDILSNGDNNIVMYVPLDYDLKYYCNSQNRNQIYSSNSIYVSFVNDLHSMIRTKLEKLINSNGSSQNIIIDYSDVDKTSIYQFAFDYNDDLNSTSLSIKSLELLKLYTLPYIDKSTACWVINDTITNFKTIADNVSPQTILITYNICKNGECQYSILNGLSNDIADTFNTSNNSNEIIRWLQRSCNFDANILVGETNESIKTAIENYTDDNGTNMITSVIAKCLVPHIRIDSNMASTFENTVLLTIFDLSTFIDSIPQNFVEAIKKTNIYNSYIFSTIWKLNTDNVITDSNNVQYYAFDYVRALKTDFSSDTESDSAFDASVLFNTNIAAVRQSLSNLNLFDSIVFYNSEVITQYKDNYSTNKKLMSIYTPRASYYREKMKTLNGYDVNEDSFKNNYVLSIQTHTVDYNSIYTRIFDPDYLRADLVSDEYFIHLNNNGNSNIVICNALYKKTNNTESYISGKTDSSNSSNLSNISSEIGGIVTSQSGEQIISISNSTNRKQDKTVVTDVLDKYVDENVFGNSVPLLDLKEILLLNNTSLNRLNIIYPEQNAIYNSFIGLPINDDLNQVYIFDRVNNSSNNLVPKRQIVELAGSSTNVNMGNEHLISQKDKNNFKTPQTLHIKFDNIVVESENEYHNTKKYTNIICGGGLYGNFGTFNDLLNNKIGSTSSLFPNVIIKSTNLNSAINNENNLPTDETLYKIISEANDVQFGLNDNASINEPSNLILFSKEINPIGVALDYDSLPYAETRAFGNTFNILWYGDKNMYYDVAFKQEFDLNIYNESINTVAQMYCPVDDSELLSTELPTHINVGFNSYTSSYSLVYFKDYYDYINAINDSNDYSTFNTFADVFNHYLLRNGNISNNEVYTWLRNNNLIKATYESDYNKFIANGKGINYNRFDNENPFVIWRTVKEETNGKRCGLEALSKYYEGEQIKQIIPQIFYKDSEYHFAQNINFTNILQDLNYVDSDGVQISNENMSINSFFIAKINPEDLWYSIYKPCYLNKDNDGTKTSDEITKLKEVIYKNSPIPQDFLNAYKERIYIFRLSDYLLQQYGLDITHEKDFVIDEEFSVQNKIFRIALNPNMSQEQITTTEDTCYAYFLIYYEDDLTIRKFRYSTNDIYINTTLNLVDETTNNKEILQKDNYNINYYEIVCPKRPIKFIKRKIVKYAPEDQSMDDPLKSSSNANYSAIFNTDYVYNILF